MQDKTQVIITAIIAILILEAIALAKGIDGVLLASAFTIIGGLAGYKVKSEQNKRLIRKLTQRQ